eukprot:GHRQ01028805.1.p1 GENE.GHRQ01028805.1~~GHRQ01028805.1.p1  ORF type:complete len:206 (-),score=27.98 GHRQ01028805.1:86-703(-)
MRHRLHEQGLDSITPKIMVVTRLIPQAMGTTCNERIERIHGTEHAYILRVPWRDESGRVRACAAAGDGAACVCWHDKCLDGRNSVHRRVCCGSRIAELALLGPFDRCIAQCIVTASLCGVLKVQRTLRSWSCAFCWDAAGTGGGQGVLVSYWQGVDRSTPPDSLPSAVCSCACCAAISRRLVHIRTCTVGSRREVVNWSEVVRCC